MKSLPPEIDSLIWRIADQGNAEAIGEFVEASTRASVTPAARG